METVLETNETWRLEYSYGQLGPSLSICYINCNSLEECQAQYKHILQYSNPPLWAHAVHSIERHTEETTVSVLKMIEPPQEDDALDTHRNTVFELKDTQPRKAAEGENQ